MMRFSGIVVLISVKLKKKPAYQLNSRRSSTAARWLHVGACAPVAQSGARRSTTPRSGPRNFATRLVHKIDSYKRILLHITRALQARMSRTRAHVAPQPSCRFTPAADFDNRHHQSVCVSGEARLPVHVNVANEGYA